MTNGRSYAAIKAAAMITLLVWSASAAPAANAQERAGVTQSSYERAKQTLDAGIEALGGLARLRAAGRVSVNYREQRQPPGQNSAFTAPPVTVPTTGQRTMINYDTNRYFTEGQSNFPGGFSFNFRQVVTPTLSFSIDLLRNRRGNTIVNLSPAQQANVRLNALLEFPHLLLLYILDRAETLRSLGEATVDGRAHQVVSFAAENGTQISLYFDARTNLPARYELLNSHPLLGDVTNGAAYVEYQTIGGIRIPQRRRALFNNNIVGETEYAEVALEFNAPDSLLEIPAGYVEPTPATGAAAEPVRRLGAGVFLLPRLPGNYNVMFVEFADHVMILEAPLNTAISGVVLSLIRRTVPDKPIRYVSFSHFHFDHTGGLREYIAAGATVVTTPGNRPFVEAIARSRFTLRPDTLARSPRAPVIETFDRRRVFTDGTRTLELHQIGPTAHVADMTIFYFPQEKILFQGDMFSQTETGEIPPIIESNRELLRKVEELGLEVETLIGVHGGAIAWQTFREAVIRQRP